MAESEAVPRSLRISFEFEVPRTLKGLNIRHTSYQKALDTIAERVIGMSEGLFPWAGEVIVRKQWLYNWIDDTERVQLPETDANTSQ